MRWGLLVVSLLLLSCSCKQVKKKGDSNMTDQFKTLRWAHSTNIYEVNLRQYSPEGSFHAFEQALPRLREMGVETLWFMPIYPIGKDRRKGIMGSYYSIRDYTAVNEEYGSAEDLKDLLKEAHRLGFKMIFDWVANHCSWDNVWTQTHPDYFVRDSAGGFLPPFPGWEDVIKLNYENHQLRTAMIEAMQYWVKEFGIDGFRCDMAHLVPLEFWKEARRQLDAIKPLFWLGEYDELDHPQYGEAFDASYSWTWMHATEGFYKKKSPLDSLCTVIKRYDDLGDRTMRIWFTSNHDENSWNGTEYEKYGDMAKALAVFSATWNGIPMVYSGQELPNKKRIRFFDKDTIPWTGNNELHDFYKTLLGLHSNHPALRAGDPAVQTFRIKTNDPQHVFAYLRKNNSKEVLVVLNLSGQDHLHFDILDDKVTGSFKNVFSGASNDFTREKSFEMQAWEYLLYEK